jgi:DNA invertase Pin-like site-specific DNA recombinase
MSTDHQRYSTENQSDAIKQYAEARGIEIVRTYADAGKSGLKIGNCSRGWLKKACAGGVGLNPSGDDSSAVSPER